MAVADLPRRPFTTQRPTIGHMLWTGFQAWFATGLGIIGLAVIAWLLPGGAESIVARATESRSAFDVHTGLGVLPIAGEGVIEAALFGGAMSRLVHTPSGRYPSFYWTGLSALGGSAVTLGVSRGWGWIVALVLTHQLAFDREGRPRRSPIRFTSSVKAGIGAACVVSCALVVAGGIAAPLVIEHGSGSVFVAPVRKPDLGSLPSGTVRLHLMFRNRGPRDVQVTGVTWVRPAGLQLLGLRRELPGTIPGGPMQDAFTPVRVRPDQYGELNLMVKPDCTWRTFAQPIRIGVRYTAGGGSHETQLTVPSPDGPINRC